MKKMVLDTNVILSAFFSSKGASYRLLELLVEGSMVGHRYSVVSVPLILEYEEVLFRPKNRKQYDYFTDDELRKIVSDIVAISHQTQLHFLWRPFLKDSFDDKVLETAVNGQASTIVTFNTKDFEGVKEAFGIEIVKPAQILGVLR